MKKLALMVLVLELAVCGCGNNTRSTTVTTSTSGNWEAQMIGGMGPGLNFVTSFTVTSTTGFTPQPLDITGFGFFNEGACFSTGNDAETETGTATLNTAGSGAVTGGLTFTVNSTTIPGNVLTLTSVNGLTGTSNGTTSTTGTLTNGIVVGTWSLTSTSNSSCAGSGTFIMCQGTSTCTPP
ncbi:MAG: hypothetical protein ABSG34_02500 [Candidatus Sulfotelmatobacter sp.]|jgi:hypothetical protein